jgi:hypothetical protein
MKIPAILIIVATSQGFCGETHTLTTQEFHSYDSCNEAVESIEFIHKRKNIMASCVIDNIEDL